MKTLIAYSTKYGTAEKCAKLLKKKLKGDVTLADIGKDKKVDVKNFDCIIIGGPIYIGKLRGETKKFCERNLEMLKNKKIGLFKCGLENEKDAEQIINEQYPKGLVEIAIAKAGFGGASYISKMRGMDKFMFTKMAKTTEDSEKIDYDMIDEFVKLMRA